MELFDYSRSSLVPPGVQFQDVEDAYFLKSVRLLALHAGDGGVECSLHVRKWRLETQAASNAPTLDNGDQETESTRYVQEAQTDFPLVEPYYALTYTWSHDDECSITLVDGDSKFQKFIGRNLHSALMALRTHYCVRLGYIEVFLWVDSLCIDQKNAREKNRQLFLLPQIYHQAQHVDIWLGPSDEKSKSREAMEFIRRGLASEDFEDFLVDGRHLSKWTALFTLMRRRWFSRRWIIQEIALARSAILHCGDDSVGWDRVLDVLSVLVKEPAEFRQLFRESRERGYHPDFIGDLNELGAVRLARVSEDLFRKSALHGTIINSRHSLEALVTTLCHFMAGDPKAVLYAIVSLCDDAYAVSKEEYAVVDVSDFDDYRFSSMRDPERQLDTPTNGMWTASRDKIKIVVDFEKGHFEVCRDLLEFVVRRSASLDLMCFPWAPHEEDVQRDGETLPSWMCSGHPSGPDYNYTYRRVNADPLVGMPGNGEKPYAASGQRSLAAWKLKPSNARCLVVRGFLLDSIAQLENSARHGVVPYEWTTCGGWDDVRSDPPDVFWRTLVGNRDPNGTLGKVPPRHWRGVCRMAWQRTPPGGDLDPQSLMLDCRPITMGFLERVRVTVWRRRLVTFTELSKTSNGSSLGLAPLEAREGDLVCILYGCSVPVVLRVSNQGATDEDTYYKFIGECYVHGMMDGEAIALRGRDNIPNQEFQLL